MQAPSVPDLPPRQASLLAGLRQADGELTGQDLHAQLRGGPAAMGLASISTTCAGGGGPWRRTELSVATNRSPTKR